MPDLSKLLDDSYASYARESARPSDVDALLRRGAVRRRRSQVRVVTSTVLVIAVIVGAGVLGITGGGSEDQRPAPAPAPTPSPKLELKDMTPEQIVQHEDASLEYLAVSETDPDVRASAWSLCGGDRCGRVRMAVTVTDDGFDTAAYVPVERRGWYLDLMPLGDDTFYVDAGRRTRGVLSVDGDITPLARSAQAARLEAGEALIPPTRAVAEDGTIHRVDVPAGTNMLIEQSGDRLVGFTGGAGPGTVAIWSDDGGESWNRHQLQGHRSALYQVLESSDPDTIAILEGADGATLLPVVAFHVSRDGGATWERVEAPEPDGETGYLSWAVVRPDGSLLIQFEAWSDDRLRKPSKRSRGPYESDGADWSTLMPVSPGMPGNDKAAYRRLQSVTHGGNDVRLYVSQDTRAYVSADGGNAWEKTAAR